MPGLNPDDSDEEDNNVPRPAFINNINDESIANVFCFGAFAEKNTSVIYNDCTGNFPFMSLDGNICFFMMYHYKTNAIFTMPIPGLDSENILNTYKKNFEYLSVRGTHRRLTSWTIKQQRQSNCTLPHNNVTSS